MTYLRDQLALIRIARMKQRCARMQVMATALRVEDRLAAASLSATAEGLQMLREACSCVNCQLRRAQLADEAIKATH